MPQLLKRNIFFTICNSGKESKLHLITRYGAALNERIASFIARATADWIVVDNSAIGVLATDSCARIFTPLVDTGLC